MTEDVKALQQERTQILKDVYDGKIPKRVPIEIAFAWEAAIEHSGLDMREALWDENSYFTFMDSICSEFPCDKQPIGGTLRRIGYYHYMDSKAYVMGETGAIQHPEVHALEPEEYDEFIADPYKCMVEKLLPRLNPAVASDKFDSSIKFAKAYKAFNDAGAAAGAAARQIRAKYGYADLPAGGSFYSPLDFLADIIRSFTGIITDMRRYPEKVEAACEAVLPLCLCTIIKEDPAPYTRPHIPLHMAPFMNRRDFDRFWWPPFLKFANTLFDAGINIDTFCENDWMDKTDYLESLKNRSHYHFEFGDPAYAKKELHGKHIVSGFYPVTNLITMPKQQCVDEAKKLIDILAPNGGYIFNFDKIFFSVKGQTGENLKAVLDTVMTYGVY